MSKYWTDGDLGRGALIVGPLVILGMLAVASAETTERTFIEAYIEIGIGLSIIGIAIAGCFLVAVLSGRLLRPDGVLRSRLSSWATRVRRTD
jgi:uncharacterized integral membrane protein